MAKSQKTLVIEHLFDKHWNSASGTLDKSLMSLDDVAQAIRECNKVYARQQSEAFSDRTGKLDVRGAYGLLGREVI